MTRERTRKAGGSYKAETLSYHSFSVRLFVIGNLMSSPNAT
jgi:hypothetical protein